MKKRVLSMVLALCLVLTLMPVTAGAAGTVASGTCGANVRWELDEYGTLTISGYGEMSNFSAREGYTYIPMNPPWFSVRSQVKNVVINKGVTTIGDYAFSSCSSTLTTVSIPEGIYSIGYHAFYGCKYLTELTLPNSLTSLGYGAFSKCDSLTSVSIPPNLDLVTSCAFSSCTSLSDVFISEGVTCLSDAFRSCKGLTCITIPKSVTSISYNTFDGCQDLSIYCYKDSYAHQFAQRYEIPFVLLDEPDDPSPEKVSIQSVILVKDGATIDPLTQTAEFAQNSADTADVSVTVNWGDEETGRTFLIQDRDTYVELPASFVPGTKFVPDAPIYVIATNADADTLLDWKEVKLEITVPEEPEITLSLWADAGCSAPITAMTSTYGSFSWEQTGTNYNTAYLRVERGGTGDTGMVLTAPNGFSFQPYRMVSKLETVVDVGNPGVKIVPVYPIYAENPGTELTFAVEGTDTKLTIPVTENSEAGNVYYRDSFTEQPTGSLQVNNFSMSGFDNASTQYDDQMAKLSACLSAAAYNERGIERTLANFGFSQIVPCNYNFGNDQISVNQDEVACSFATKKYITNGEVYTIVVVPIRGTVEKEWYSNFEIGIGDTHFGFSSALWYVRDQMRNYMDALQDAGLTADRTKILVTGHSRGAAVADLLALDLNTVWKGQYATHDNQYTYTFATPNSVRNDKIYSNEAQNNIFNIQNYQDIVTHVPGGFYSSGNNRYVNDPGDANYSLKFSKFQENFNRLVKSQSPAHPDYLSWGNHTQTVIAVAESRITTGLANTVGDAIASAMLSKNDPSLWGPIIAALLEGTALPNVGKAVEYVTDRIWCNHAMETYICWLDVMEKYGFSQPANSTNVKVMCPVDVTVYNEQGTVVSRIVDNEVVQCDGPYCGVDGEEKAFYLSNSSYTFEITGYDSGSMDIEITEYDADNQQTKFIAYADIPVETDKTVTLNAKDCGSANSEYTLVMEDGETKAADYTAMGGELNKFTVTVSAEGSGYALGGGSYSEGQRAMLYALADKGTFQGWYINEECVSTQETYMFPVKGDIQVAAKFTARTSGEEPTDTPDQPTDTPNQPGGSTNTPPSNSSGGGGYSSSSSYSISIPTRVTGGTVKVSSSNAPKGATVTITATPNSGYELDCLTVTDSRGNEIKLTAQGDGKYTFAMPSRAVTVKATFTPLLEDVEQPCDGGADCPSRGFTDLGSVGTWYHEAVDYVIRNRLMGGYGSGPFGPNDNLSRAQLVQILWNKEDRPVVNYLLQYSDVAAGAWYTGAVRWATGQGIAGGYGNGKFGPNDNITREQLAVMLWRYAGSPAATEKELHFTDIDEADNWSLEALRWAVESGVLEGYGNERLNPKGLATRAQAAQMLKNYLER